MCMCDCLYQIAMTKFLTYRYMDPGNWATNIAGGAAFGYTLILVIFLSSITAMFVQFLALKLGIVSNRDLAQACRDAYRPWVSHLQVEHR